MSEQILENPLIVALDVDTAESARDLAKKLATRAGAFKLGPRLNRRYGADLVKEIAQLAPVFIDNKYLDIPNTMETAVRATFEAGATLTTVHAWSGPEALERLAKVEKELSQKRPVKILAVTILTSFSPKTLPPGYESKSIEESVDQLATLALNSGLSGIVCSPHEAHRLRVKSKDAYLVTPGIRMPTDSSGDQKRIETPAEAMRKGASALVVGRPIVEANDPIEAADRVLASIAEASS